MAKHNVFISYHHDNDQYYREELLKLNDKHEIFIDKSVYEGDINEELDDQVIRKIIRDKNLRDSTVTILLVGTKTKRRKHIDWELYSSMYDGVINKKSGILVINLPTITGSIFAAHSEQESYPDIINWTTYTSRDEYEKNHPYLPERIIENMLIPKVKISVTNWENVESDPFLLSELIDKTFKSRIDNDYDLSKKMRKNNS
ncbi:TIR domain-containing protein [Pectobacterium brasiliense]|uniref:TIR domain-containing protein n=1 Tax=Pectobacterium brasiliense TaxID=180957 RepID=UPI0030D12987